MRTFSNFDRWRQLAGDERAYEVYRYLADKETGLFHMNVVEEGKDGLSEFVQIRDPVKIINVYGYAYCGILGPTMAGVCEGIGLELRTAAGTHRDLDESFDLHRKGASACE